jgi:hypothetical protein
VRRRRTHERRSNKRDKQKINMLCLMMSKAVAEGTSREPYAL